MGGALHHGLWSDKSEAMAGPTSSGSPARPSAVCEAMNLLNSGLSRTLPPPKSVSIAPGATVLTAIWRAPSSLARYRVSTSIAPCIVKLGALLSADCAIPGDDLSSLYGDSLTV